MSDPIDTQILNAILANDYALAQTLLNENPSLNPSVLINIALSLDDNVSGWNLLINGLEAEPYNVLFYNALQSKKDKLVKVLVTHAKHILITNMAGALNLWYKDRPYDLMTKILI
jgi:hypothetical protein